LVTLDSLASAAKVWASSLNKAIDLGARTETERANLIAQLILHVSRLTSLLRDPAESSTFGPIFGPQHKQLEALMKLLESSVADILKFQKSKQDELSYWGSELVEERELFVYFFVRPDVLVSRWRALYNRAQARVITAIEHNSIEPPDDDMQEV